LCTSDKINYIENEWSSIPLCASDRISSNEVKTKYDITTRDLLIETLIREARLNNASVLEIPLKFLTLIETDIINKVELADKKRQLWIDLGRWLGSKEPIRRRNVREHLRLKWKKLEHGMGVQNNIEPRELQSTIGTYITRNKKVELILSARENFQSLSGLVDFHQIVEPGCIVDRNNGTLVHLENINQTTVTQAMDAVNRYYFHTLEHPSHWSSEFWTNFIEHFGVYTRNNLLPFTSSNTASSHNVEHQNCVDNLIQGLSPLSNCINSFIQENYGEMYTKLRNLTWGPFSPRHFGIFPMIAINFNTISDYHWDEHDEPNSLCCLVALGEFEGGELCFPQLQIVVPLRVGQVVAFSSRLLLHGNFPLTKGIRHSIVYFVHGSFFHHLRDFTEVYKDREERIERDSHGSIVSSIPQQDINDARGLNRQI
jgi:hypothetical protein